VTLSIDTEAATGAAENWSYVGDAMAANQLEVEGCLDRLAFESIDCGATRALAAAANQLWCASRLVVLAIEAALAGDRIDIGPLVSASHVDDPAPYSPGAGDLDVLGSEVRSAHVFEAGSDRDLGTELAIAALEATASPVQTRGDEFQLVRYGPSQYKVVLPGVTDLSHPDLGFSDANATPRDLDQAALGAFGRAAVGFDSSLNPYARQVNDALIRAGVPSGSDLVIIGHSFGAEVALELASDEAFASRYNVTHVLAVGYDSEPQLDDVIGDAQVMVLQNHWDVPAQGERMVRAAVQKISPTRILDDATDPIEIAKTMLGPAGQVPGVIGWFRDDGRDDRRVVRFSGGVEGAGHDQDNYIDFIAAHPDEMGDFLTGVGSVLATRGQLPSSQSTKRRAIGTATAIDVTVPDS
jgi:pimeloyl-ACP methyl ester carboxylesterase